MTTALILNLFIYFSKINWALSNKKCKKKCENWRKPKTSAYLRSCRAYGVQSTKGDLTDWLLQLIKRLNILRPVTPCQFLTVYDAIRFVDAFRLLGLGSNFVLLKQFFISS